MLQPVSQLDFLQEKHEKHLLKQHCFGAQLGAQAGAHGAGAHGAGAQAGAHGAGAQQVVGAQQTGFEQHSFGQWNVGQWNVGQQIFGQLIVGQQIFGQWNVGQQAGASGAPAIATTITTLYISNPPQSGASHSAPDAALSRRPIPHLGRM